MDRLLIILAFLFGGLCILAPVINFIDDPKNIDIGSAIIMLVIGFYLIKTGNKLQKKVKSSDDGTPLDRV